MSAAVPVTVMGEPACQVLASLFGGPLPGSGIIALAGQLSGGRVRLVTGTLYTLLDRLAAEGYVRVAGRDAVAGQAGCRYALTSPGLSALQASASRRTAGGGPVPGAGDGGGAGKIVSIGGRVRVAGDEDPVTRLERRFRLLLHAYPAAYRRDRAEEMVGTLLETTPAGRAWPLARDSRALLLGGLRARSAQNRRLGTPASLRLAALLGCAVFLCCIASNYVSYGQQAVAIPAGQIPGTNNPWQFASGWALAPALLILAAVLLAWLPGRKAVALGAVVAGTAAVAYDFSVAPTPRRLPGCPSRTRRLSRI